MFIRSSETYRGVQYIQSVRAKKELEHMSYKEKDTRDVEKLTAAQWRLSAPIALLFLSVYLSISLLANNPFTRQIMLIRVGNFTVHYISSFLVFALGVIGAMIFFVKASKLEA